MSRRVLALGACLLGLGACMEPPPEPTGPPEALAVGEAREIELYAIRFDVLDYEQTVTKADILALPDHVRDDLWLYDLDLSGGSGTPRLLDNALSQVRDLDPDDPALTLAERNMVRLLNMTPDTAELEGTALEELLSIAPKLGFAAPEVLSDALGIGVEDPFLQEWAVTEAVLAGVIGTHPNARTRAGADGPIAVPPGHVPVTLGDAASDLRTMPEKFGPILREGEWHPGFIVATSGAAILGDDFSMTLRASTNALPFKGVDLTNGEVGSVTSIGKDGRRLFDFSDPGWIQFEGILDHKTIDELTFQILEHPELLSTGDSPYPSPWGNSPVWVAPPWTLERVVAEAGLLAFGERDFERDWFLGDSVDPLFQVDINAGWMAMTTKGNVGSPPAPLYIWDLMGEVAQARLHDGGVAEGKAHVRFVLRDVDIGVTTEQITEAIKANLELDPAGLVVAARELLDQSYGAPDLYYFRPRASAPAEVQGDWLFYITDDDLPSGSDRLWSDYSQPGFFADEALTDRVSAHVDVDGDTAHDKVRISTGDVLYVADDAGGRFRIEVLAKPSESRVRLDVSRVQ